MIFHTFSSPVTTRPRHLWQLTGPRARDSSRWEGEEVLARPRALPLLLSPPGPSLAPPRAQTTTPTLLGCPRPGLPAPEDTPGPRPRHPPHPCGELSGRTTTATPSWPPPRQPARVWTCSACWVTTGLPPPMRVWAVCSQVDRSVHQSVQYSLPFLGQYQ